MYFFLYIQLDQLPHVFCMHEVDDLAAFGDDFQRLTSHEYLFVLKDLPVGEACHYPSKNLVKVLVDS